MTERLQYGNVRVPFQRIPRMMTPHWTTRAARRKFIPTAEKPYFFRNVIRNPNPTNIITFTSWNTATPFFTSNGFKRYYVLTFRLKSRNRLQFVSASNRNLTLCVLTKLIIINREILWFDSAHRVKLPVGGGNKLEAVPALQAEG